MRIQRFFLLSALAASAATTVACGRTPEDEPVSPAGRGATELRQVPATASLAGRSYRLETSLWRDFMPGPDIGANGRPLLAAVRVSTVDGGAFPADVAPDSLWVVNGADVWRTLAREEQSRGSAGPSTVEVMGREGPRWGPDISVDLVVRLRHASGATVLLRAAAQPIGRTS